MIYESRSPAAEDVPFRPAGPGVALTRNCMGCGKWRSTIDSRGTGIRWRCMTCCDARAVARAAA